MHFYQHHIGDYRKDTGHLTMLEHGAYRQLIDLYYLDENPLPVEEVRVMRLACARSTDEKEAVKNVLSDFFEKTSDGYRHKRCDAELERIYEKSEKARQSAKARWKNNANEELPESDGNANAMKKDTTAMRTHGKRMENQCDLDATHNPLTHNPSKEEPIAQNADAFAAFWAAYPKKKSKGAAEKAWNRKGCGLGLFDTIMDGLKRAKDSDDWIKDGGKFIPYPATWLNAKGWEDELGEPETSHQVDYLEGVSNA